VNVSSDPGFKVLVVEDETLLAMDLCIVLEEAGYQVVGPAATVAGALALIEASPPDACVLDLNLRGEQSSAVAQALKERSIPFLLATAYRSGTMDRHPAFDDIINVGKPLSSDALLSLLGSLLGDR